MITWSAVSRTDHARAYWQPSKDFAFVAGEQLIEVFITELSAVIPHYTLGFIRQGESEAFSLAVLLGVGGASNLYVNQDGTWMSSYIPATLKSFPFSLRTVDNNDQRVLCVAEEYLTDAVDAHAMFKNNDLATDTARTLEFLEKCDKDRILTNIACQALDESGVIEPWPIKIDRGNELEPIALEGFYRINESALNALASEELTTLRNSGGLLIAYAQLLAQAQIKVLDSRAKYLADIAAAKDSQNDELAGMLEKEDTLNFDMLGGNDQDM